MSYNVEVNRYYKFEQLVDFVSDKLSITKITLENYISTENMRNNRGGVSPATKIPSIERLNKFRVSDTLFSNIRTYFRKVWYARFDGGASADVLILRSKDIQLLHPNYLYYIISSEDFINYTVLTAKGVKMPRGDKDAIKNYKFFLPDLPHQINISKILSSIDDKIHLNTQINKTLEEMAQAIFKSWFVDFDPVKAKMAALASGGTVRDAELAAMSVISGKDKDALALFEKENPDVYKELEETVALFPAGMEDSELGEIPEGWEVDFLKNCCTAIHRGISPKYTEENGIIIINQKCIRDHSIDFSFTKYNDPQKRKIDGREIKVGDVLVNSTGVGTLGRIAPVRFLPETAVVDSHVTVVRADENKISSSYLEGLMTKNESYIEANGAGSTGQTELKRQVLEEIKFPRPTVELSMVYEKFASITSKQLSMLAQQQKILAEIRDAILPKLLSSAIDINDEA
jgi:type I restriction enzyme S subunit